MIDHRPNGTAGLARARWHRAFDELSFGEFAQESSAFFGAKKLRKWSHDI